jgi:hypothetical protein
VVRVYGQYTIGITAEPTIGVCIGAGKAEDRKRPALGFFPLTIDYLATVFLKAVWWQSRLETWNGQWALRNNAS